MSLKIDDFVKKKEDQFAKGTKGIYMTNWVWDGVLMLAQKKNASVSEILENFAKQLLESEEITPQDVEKWNKERDREKKK